MKKFSIFIYSTYGDVFLYSAYCFSRKIYLLYLFGKHYAQNMPNGLRMLPSTGGKEMQLPFGSKGLNFFSFKRIQRTEILPQEWQGNVLGRDCIM